MRRAKSPWILLLFVLCGSIAGGFLGEILTQYSFFKWMNLGGPNGYRELLSIASDPLIDAHVIRFGISFTLRVNGGSILGIILAILLYMKK